MDNKILSVVICEDDKLSGSVLKKSLETQGINVTQVFYDAESCIEGLKYNKPDIVLMDLGLPGMNGIEATSVIKDQYSDMKIVILSSHEQKHAAMAALKAGACAYYTKDTSSPALSEVLKTLKDGAIWLDAKVAGAAYDYIPSPDSTNLDNLYKNSSNGYGLTKTEHKVLHLMAFGKTNIEISEKIFVSPETVKSYVKSITQKLDSKNRTDAVGKALALGIIIRK